MRLIINNLQKTTILFMEPVGNETIVEREDVIKIDFVLKKKGYKTKMDITLESIEKNLDLLTIWDNDFNLRVFINDELEYSSDFYSYL